MATRTQFQLQWAGNPDSDQAQRAQPRPAPCLHEQMCETLYAQQRLRLQVLCEWMTGAAAPARRLALRVFVDAWRQPNQAWPAVGGDRLIECFALAFRGAFHDDAAPAAFAPGPRLMPSSRAADASGPNALRQAVAALPTPQRLLYLLHELEGCSPATVGEWLDLDPRHCAELIHQARLQLRHCHPTA